MRPRLARLLLGVAAAAAATLSIAEALARAFYEAPWYERLLDAQARPFPPMMELNRQKLRDRDYDERKSATTRRVLLLGDSFTQGFGVVDDAAIFPERVERELSAAPGLDGVDRIEILNGGLGGSLTHQWLALLERVGPQFDPDVVVAVFFLRDGTRLSALGSFFGPIREEIALRNAASALYRGSRLWRFVRDALDRRRIQESYARRFVDSFLGDESQTEEWRAAQENLRAMRDWALGRGAAFGLAIFPILVGLADDDYPFQPLCDEVRRFAQAERMPVHDLLPAFRGREPISLWVAPLDQHPNEEGHRLAAESLLPFVRALLAEHERRPR